MNLEDFKSFCRVLKPSEVGSIPTHSRHLAVPRRVRRVWIAALVGLGTASGALAVERAVEEIDEVPGGGAVTAPDRPVTDAIPETVASDPLDGEPGPLERAFRSALFPAWGQLTNGKPKKAVVLFTVQSYIYTRIILETRRAREAQRRADRFAAMDGDDLAVSFQLEAAEASAQDHFDRRRDLLFWALVGGFYGAMDAYIDAHLGEFDEELEEGRSLFGGVDPVQGRVELGMRF